MKRYPDTMRHLYARHMVAQCLLETKQFDECVKVLRDDDASDEADASYIPSSMGSTGATTASATTDSPQRSTGAGAGESRTVALRQRLLSQVCLLRGKAFIGLETRQRAIFWLRRALQLDAYCVEAFSLLSERRMLSAHSEARLGDMLSAALSAPHDAWLRDFYTASLQRDGAVSIRADASARRAIAALGGTSSTLPPPPPTSGGGTSHGLERSADVLTLRAQAAFARHEYEEAAALASRARQFDAQPDAGALLVQLSALVHLEQASELFVLAHQLVEEHPKLAISWYAVACYYMARGA
jgi:anaphase-promoting complex subunit 6